MAEADGGSRPNSAKSKESQREQAQKVDELADIIRTYRGLDEAEENHKDLPWYDSPKFDIVMCSIILVNVMVIGLEMDLAEDKKGYDRAPVWICLEWLFALIFMGEVAIKVHYMRMEWFHKDIWSFLCLGIAVMAFVDIAILSPLKVNGLRMFSLARIINLLRLKRIIEQWKALKELKAVMKGMMHTLASMGWAVGVLVLIIYVFSIWTTTLIGYQDHFTDMIRLTNGWSADDYFGGVGRSMWTLVQVLTRDSWSSGLVRQVLEGAWYMMVFFAVFMFLTTYGVMNLIISVIVEQTLSTQSKNEGRMKASEEKEKEQENEVLREIYLLSDIYAHGDLGLPIFEQACKEDAEVRWRMRQLELPFEDVKRLFQVMDGDGTRSLNMKEFMEGCSKLKGTARSKELMALQAKADMCAKKMDLMSLELQDTERMLQRLDAATTRMTARFGSTTISSRKRIRDTVRGSAPLVPLKLEKKGSYATAVNDLAVGNKPLMPRLPDLVG